MHIAGTLSIRTRDRCRGASGGKEAWTDLLEFAYREFFFVSGKSLVKPSGHFTDAIRARGTQYEELHVLLNLANVSRDRKHIVSLGFSADFSGIHCAYSVLYLGSRFCRC